MKAIRQAFVGWSFDVHRGFENRALLASPRGQVVRIQVPGGQITKLTNDLNQYAGVSLAGDTLVTVRWQTRSGLWAMDADGSDARAVATDVAESDRSPGPTEHEWFTRLVWLAATAHRCSLPRP